MDQARLSTPRARKRFDVPIGGVIALVLAMGLWGYGMLSAPSDKRSADSFFDIDWSAAERLVNSDWGKRHVTVDPDDAADAERDAADAREDAEQAVADAQEAIAAIGGGEALASADPGHGAVAAGALFNRVELSHLAGDIHLKVDERGGQLRIEDKGGKLQADFASGSTFTFNGRAKVEADLGGDGVLRLSGRLGDPVDLTLTVPRGAAVSVERFNGDLSIAGDLNGPVALELGKADVRLGNVTAAAIRILEKADVTVGNIDGALALDVAGKGDVRAASVGSAAVRIKGNGDTRLAAVNGALAVDLRGRGNIDVGSVSGPVKTSIRGAGKVKIAAGEASSFAALVRGVGTIEFDGLAHNPQLDMHGVGKIRVARHTGSPRIQQNGTGKVDAGIAVAGPEPALAPPVPPVPPAPPAPPAP